MDRNFYLWSKSALSIGCVEMKKIRSIFTSSHEETPIINEYMDEGYRLEENKKIIDSIIKSPYIEEKTKQKFMSKTYSEDYMYGLINDMKKRNISFITIDDDIYPKNLREIYDPPYIIFYLGNIKVLEKSDIMAVVGSRKASDYGKRVTKKIVTQLASKGIVIVSGMASGVDSYAHIYCMKTGTSTIAVLGTPIDKVYPIKNTKLRNEILENGGLIISEYNYDSTTRPSNFAYRNRIISGISKGVLVCEAQKKSGTMITVDTALQEGRNVYSVPGSIFSSLSQGCNKLIIEGAKPVCDAEDILVDFYDFGNDTNILNRQKIEENEKNIDKKHKNTGNTHCICDNIVTSGAKTLSNSNKLNNILQVLKDEGAMDIDHIHYITGYDISTIVSGLNKLYLMGEVIDIGNNIYALASDS